MMQTEDFFCLWPSPIEPVSLQPQKYSIRSLKLLGFSHNNMKAQVEVSINFLFRLSKNRAKEEKNSTSYDR